MTIINTKDNKSIKYYKNYNISPNTTSLSLNLKPLNVSEIKSNEVVIAISQETKKISKRNSLWLSAWTTFFSLSSISTPS